MTRIAFVADVHVGNPKKHPGPYSVGFNARGRLVLDTLRKAVAVSNDHGCVALVSLGDLFDGVRPNPQTIAAVQEIVDDCPQFIALLGNHEMVSAYPGDHSLAPLHPLSDIVDRTDVIDIDGVVLGLVPFRPGPAEEWLPIELAKLGRQEGSAILCLHLGIGDSRTPSFMQKSHDFVNVEWLQELLACNGWSWSAAGNWHEKRRWGEGSDESTVLQVGTLSPTGWNNPGFEDYGWMAIWGDDWEPKDGGGPLHAGFKSVRIPGPRFVKVRSEAELEAAIEEGLRSDCTLFVEWVSPADELAANNSRVQELIGQGGVFAGGAIPDERESSERAREAARAASSTETLAAALVAYIGGLELPKGVTRARILELAKGYLVPA